MDHGMMHTSYIGLALVDYLQFIFLPFMFISVRNPIEVNHRNGHMLKLRRASSV